MVSYFNKWPFNVTAPEEPTFIADRQEILKRFESLFSSFFQNKSSSFYCMAGMFGSGKSHFLKYFRFKYSESNNAFFLYTPSFITDVKNFKDFYIKTLADNFSNPDFMKNLKMIWRGCVKNLGIKEARNYLYSEIANNWSDLANILIILLEWVNYEDMGELMSSQEFYLGSSWLKGVKLNKKEKSLIKVRRNVETDEDAIKIFSSFIKFLTSQKTDRSYKTFIWAIDDCHFIKDIKNRFRDQILRGFKLCLDGNVNNYLFIMSFAVHTKEEVDLYLLRDLIDRRKATPIFLPQLNANEAEIFIKDILINSDKIINNDDLFPFDEEGIKVITNYICKRDPIITPRKIQIEMGNIIQIAEKELSPDKITKEFIIKYFEEKIDE